jgi:hypothetical protein
MPILKFRENDWPSFAPAAIGELLGGTYETEANGGNGLLLPVDALPDQGLSKLNWPVTAWSTPGVQPPLVILAHTALLPYKENVGLNGAISAA